MNIKSSKSTSFLNVFLDIYRRLSKKYQRKFWVMFGLIVLVSFFEMVSVGSIALFASVIASSEEFLQSKYIPFLREILQVDYIYTTHGIIIAMSVLMIVLVALKNGLYTLKLYKSTRFCADVDAFFGDALFKGFINMPYRWHILQNSADLVKAMQGRNHIGFNFIDSSLKIMSDITLVIFLLGSLIFFQPYISFALLLLGMGGAFLIFRMTLHLQRKHAKRCLDIELLINKNVTKGIHGIKDVKISGQKSFTEDIRNNVYSYARTVGLRNLYRDYPVVLMEILSLAMLAGAVCFMAAMTGSSVAQITGVLSLLVVTAWKVLGSITKVMGALSSFNNSLPFIQWVIQYIEQIELNEKTDDIVDDKVLANFKFENEIRFENVSYLYEGSRRYVLKDINFNIKKGQTIGIIGFSGAGKSTLIDIFIGLLEPSSGKIVVDDDELNAERRHAWMKRVGYVPQSPYIYDGTLLGNVAFGLHDSEVDRDLALECCKAASMNDFLDDLPQGIDTPVGERGVRLSGGQKQRVVVARALYTKPEVIIFDEATSSLDSRSEKGIQKTIYSLRGKQTLVIIAHRLTTVVDCDLIVWIEDGRIRMFDAPDRALSEYEDALNV
ncbi:Xenobiotic-transporting ATPase [Candidatus Desulfarcum epimagneticum]|uniref:Xenobiotic-transporting ATPase n=1 Tax=uncultured Desulfobacteraceae bacterium TaxID=218296 RepID=A0A484HMI8_9BACT|nr:Xenobiotic-transporting ATPase [uncultured Desulfobacteraceae bacterium]